MYKTRKEHFTFQSAGLSLIDNYVGRQENCSAAADESPWEGEAPGERCWHCAIWDLGRRVTWA